jgi:hypothetical protein
MTPKTVEYYDWFEDLQPIILANLNEILVSKGITPLHDLHGGQFYEGKWERVNGHSDYRNYWHAYIDLWGERVRNDSYDEIYFPWCIMKKNGNIGTNVQKSSATLSVADMYTLIQNGLAT